MRRAVLVVVCAVGPSGLAAADVSPQDAAQATLLFEQGHDAIEAGRIDEACTRFEKSLALDPLFGTKLNLADCRERQGRLAEAYRLFAEGADEAAAAGKDVRAKFARTRLDQLAGRVVKIKIQVTQPDAPGLALELTTPDGTTALPHDKWSAIQIATPGAVSLAATAPHYKPEQTSRTGTAGGELVIVVPALSAVVDTTPTPTSPAPATGGSKRGLFVAGAGGALLVGSLALGLHAKSIYNDAFTHKGPEIDTEITRAEHWADVGTGFAVAGVIAAAVGGYLYFHDREVTVAPTPDGHGAAVVLGGDL
jgi:hypothetical protein